MKVGDVGVEIALQSALLFFLLGSVFSLVYGIGLLMGSAWVFRLNDWGKRWVSTRQAMRTLDAPRDAESALYQGHVWSGLVIAIASGYVLGVLGFQYDTQALIGLLRSRDASWASDLAVRASWMLLVLGALAGLLLGLSLMLRPQLLKNAQAKLNRNFSARRSTRFLEVMNLGPDQWIAAYPKTCGALITLGSVYIAYSLGVVLLSRA